ncbi:putative dehydrogenase [Aeropyrum pernix K1]|uniref:Dehydrogenase n=1 Tax=Aeropyrum pernix (strain ATCC 700893 / DSM 11879 / JCM 9820 / NBRC 100138 / K1) TaxID=272557 RepID=Q9YE14_AERPE|nr:NAD(P)-dependent oxidoreductase [Aeropyrum pernix]BAA79733.2 putative dehydrogenase [Aeropyrum pernix K1]
MVERVAVVGAGRMGSGAARRLASRGYRVVVWSRSWEKAERLAREAGLEAARSLVDALAESEAAIAFVSDDDALLNVVSQVRRSDGLIFVNSATTTPRASVSAARYLEGLGVQYVEAPVIGGPGALERGEAIVLAAAPRSALAPAVPLLSELGELVKVGESYGMAAAMKLAFNNLLLTTLVGLGESLLILDAYGVDKTLFSSILERTVFSGLAGKYFERAVSKPKPTFTVSLAEKDARYAFQALADRGYPRLVSQAVSNVYAMLSHMGFGDEDYVGVYRLLKKAGAGGGEES